MANYGDSFLKRTGKSLSILAFETTKQSRIMKKRMRITALQKEVKADLRDLGSLVYNAVTSKRDDVLADEEVKILVENVTENNTEIERLRDSIGRISQAKKHFEEGDEEIADSEIAEPTLDKPAEEPVVEEAPVEEPVAAEPVAEESSEEPAAEEPTEEQPTEEPAAEEANEEPTLEQTSKPKRTRKASTTPRKRAAKKTAEGDEEEK